MSEDILIFYDSLFCISESIHYIPLIENILNIMVLILLLRCIYKFELLGNLVS